jgi:hypothetical protein
MMLRDLSRLVRVSELLDDPRYDYEARESQQEDRTYDERFSYRQREFDDRELNGGFTSREIHDAEVRLDG